MAPKSSCCALVLALTLAGCGDNLPPLPTVEGPACAVSDAAAFAGDGKRLKTHRFNDLTFRRRSGHLSCLAYKEGSLCHLSNPTLLHVSGEGKQWWFAPGRGERVALVFARGEARCVIEPASSTEDWARKHMQPACRASPIKECP